MLLRLGAGVNALETMLQLMIRISPGNSLPSQMWRLHAFITAVAYFREIVTTIEKEGYENRLFELADKGAPFAKPFKLTVSELRPFLSPTHPRLGGNALLRIRDKVAFHWDREPFRLFVERSKAATLDLFEVSVEDDNFARIFSASAHALSAFYLQAPTAHETRDQLADLEQVGLGVGHLLECAFLGLIVECGEPRPTKYLIEG
jgi:hypothetical protein